MSTHSPSTNPKQEEDQDINIQLILDQYLQYWKWFVLSVILCVAAAFIYLRYAQNIYTISSKILLQDESSASGELAGLSELANLTGGGSTPAFVSDQIDVIKSRRIFQKVVEHHKLNIQYTDQSKLKSLEINENQSPVKLVVLDGNQASLDSTKHIFTINENDGQLIVELDNQRIENYGYGQKIKTSFGDIMLTPQGNKKLHGELVITLRPIDRVVELLMKDVQVTPNKEKQSYIVNFSMNSANVDRAKLIINAIVEQYNQDVTNDKNKVVRATSEFIDSRLKLIGDDLASADSRVADYKDKNSTIDMGSEAQLYMNTAADNDKKLVEYQTQLMLADMMASSMVDDFGLLPSNLGLSDISIEASIKVYNDLILEREDLLKSSTANNPTVKNLEVNIRDIRTNLKNSLANYRKVLQANVASIQKQRNKFEGKLGQIPNQERDFKTIARQQQIVESLYLFLLQKREETEIKASATPAILKVIDAAYASTKPVAPKRSIILLASFIIGLLIPFVIVYVKTLLDNKIHTRKDLESTLAAPILGEVPKSDVTIITDNDRSSLAESFRILRTNISFMLGGKKDSAVLFVTSTTSGEGKSFVSTNLAGILAMSGKRVLLLGADIRSPKVLDYLGLSELQHTNIGITQYLINPDMDIDNIIIKKPADYKFDIIYSGYIAPNPAELLMNGYFDRIIDYGRDHYDYVLVDTAPVGLVTDTLLINHNADLTLYVARAGYLDKRMLTIPKELYENDKLKNMAMVLNDVDFTKGYGYGYGYGYGEKVDKSFLDKLKATLKSKK